MIGKKYLKLMRLSIKLLDFIVFIDWNKVDIVYLGRPRKFSQLLRPIL